ncbi:MAG: hypothetical protein SOT15_05025 [Treponema sp.]|nr:hypothetical protein [Treponema sp.]
METTKRRRSSSKSNMTKREYDLKVLQIEQSYRASREAADRKFDEIRIKVESAERIKMAEINCQNEKETRKDKIRVLEILLEKYKIDFEAYKEQLSVLKDSGESTKSNYMTRLLEYDKEIHDLENKYIKAKDDTSLRLILNEQISKTKLEKKYIEDASIDLIINIRKT